MPVVVVRRRPVVRRPVVRRPSSVRRLATVPRKPPPRINPATVFKWAPYGTRGVNHDNCYDYAFDYFNPRSTGKTQMGNLNKYNSQHPKLTGYTSCDGIAKRVLDDYRGLAYKLPNGSAPVKPGYYKVMNFVAPGYGDFHWYRQISWVVYKTRAPGNKPIIGMRRHGDTVQGLAAFFQVPQAVIRAAYARARRPVNANDGRVSMNVTDLRRLNGLNDKPDRDGMLRPGRVMTIPVKLWAHKQGFGGGPVLVDASGRTIRDPRRADRNYGGLNYSRFCGAYAVKYGAGRVALARARRAGLEP